jgi:hypothetical protein
MLTNRYVRLALALFISIRFHQIKKIMIPTITFSPLKIDETKEGK